VGVMGCSFCHSVPAYSTHMVAAVPCIAFAPQVMAVHPHVQCVGLHCRHMVVQSTARTYSGARLPSRTKSRRRRGGDIITWICNCYALLHVTFHLPGQQLFPL
jgi:hypothetical protein